MHQFLNIQNRACIFQFRKNLTSGVGHPQKLPEILLWLYHFKTHGYSPVQVDFPSHPGNEES